jgi:integrase
LAADYLLRSILRSALMRAGLPALRFHDLRHLCCTIMAELGVPIKEAMAVMGHANELPTMKIYTHVWSHKRSDVADRIAVSADFTFPGNTPETITDLKSEE